MNTSLFPEFLSYIKENDLIIKKSMSFYSEDFIDLSIFKLFAKALVYLINEKRENQSLIGLTLEERYKYFTKHYVLTGIILDEIRTKFPNIHNSFDYYILKTKNVSFSYYGNKQVIKDFNLTIRPGEKIVILGESGSGKTTLLNVLLGLYNYQGDIYYGIKDFRKKLGVVTQNMNLTSGPLIKNLIGNSKIAPKVLNEVTDAINAVNMTETIDQLPKKIFSNLFQNGKNLSGGQIQRLLVAKSLLNDSKLLVWDEPFSNLDNLNREKIYNNILNSSLYNDKTLILSSHHTDCVKYMDRIIFIHSNGQIDIGSDEELRNNNLEYKQFIGTNKGENNDKTNIIN